MNYFIFFKYKAHGEFSGSWCTQDGLSALYASQALSFVISFTFLELDVVLQAGSSI